MRSLSNLQFFYSKRSQRLVTQSVVLCLYALLDIDSRSYGLSSRRHHKNVLFECRQRQQSTRL